MKKILFFAMAVMAVAACTSKTEDAQLKEKVESYAVVEVSSPLYDALSENDKKIVSLFRQAGQVLYHALGLAEGVLLQKLCRFGIVFLFADDLFHWKIPFKVGISLYFGKCDKNRRIQRQTQNVCTVCAEEGFLGHNSGYTARNFNIAIVIHTHI